MAITPAIAQLELRCSPKHQAAYGPKGSQAPPSLVLRLQLLPSALRGAWTAALCPTVFLLVILRRCNLRRRLVRISWGGGRNGRLALGLVAAGLLLALELRSLLSCALLLEALRNDLRGQRARRTSQLLMPLALLHGALLGLLLGT